MKITIDLIIKELANLSKRIEKYAHENLKEASRHKQIDDEKEVYFMGRYEGLMIAVGEIDRFIEETEYYRGNEK